MQKRHYVTKDSWLPRICELASEARFIGVDIETFGKPQYIADYPKAALDPFMNQIRSVQIATREHSWLIDLFHVRDIEPLRRLMLDSSVTKIIQNSLFECKNFLFHWDGAYPESTFDTMLASRLFQKVYDFSHKNGLDAICKRELDIELSKDEQTSDWSRPELSDSQIEYAHRDAEILIPLYDILSKKLEEAGMTRSAQIEFDAVLGIADMELAGLTIDHEVLTKITGVIDGRLKKLEDYLITELPDRRVGFFEQKGINFDSPQQLIDAFERRTGIRLTKYDRAKDEDVESADKVALLQHRKQFPKLVDALLDYSSLSTMRGTYCDKITGYTDAKGNWKPGQIHSVTGKCHPSYKSIGQWQHRAACSKPNLNFPRPNSFGPGVSTPALVENFHCDVNFRQIFRAIDGDLFSIVDFKNNQTRIIADTPFSGESSLIEEFCRMGDLADPYLRIAAIGLNKAKEGVTKQERQNYKLLFLAMCFVCGLSRFCQQRLVDTREDIPRAKAKREIENFFMAVPGIGMWHQRGPLEAAERGYVESPLGRKVFIPEDWLTPNRAVNFPVCATEVDGAKLALGRLARALRQREYSARVVLFCYDELIVSAANNQVNEVHELQKRIMQESMQEVLKAVPAAVEGSIGTNWSAK